jgi:hypothetical protein
LGDEKEEDERLSAEGRLSTIESYSVKTMQDDAG